MVRTLRFSLLEVLMLLGVVHTEQMPTFPCLWCPCPQVSSMTRTLRFSLLEVLMLLGVMGVQVYVITKLFASARGKSVLVV